MTVVIDGRKRVVIEGVNPEIDSGKYPIKRVVGEKVTVSADVFADGHDSVAVKLLYRRLEETTWSEVAMEPVGNDRWEASFSVEAPGIYLYTVKGWVDQYQTWVERVLKKHDAGQDIYVELQLCGEILEEIAERAGGEDGEMLRQRARAFRETDDTSNAISLMKMDEPRDAVRRHCDEETVTHYDKELSVLVDRKKAGFSTWYELFPRSFSRQEGKHGTIKECVLLLPELEKMGFDVIYLPPVHPIGKTKRKGRNNILVAGEEDPGSPWAIGSPEGGHKSVHPDLGTIGDLEEFIQEAARHGIDVAMDLAFQCSPDHPYVQEHPEWFRWRPDGTAQYAENPPKKYEDIIPFDFTTKEWEKLWEELMSIVTFWAEKGVRIYRVDNPHTKPFAFWEWLIAAVKRKFPDVIFLSEAFTRPKVKYRLAKIGFSQSYTYFTWRNTKREIIEYLTELTGTEVKEYFRPNFWPNTPDILSEYLQFGGRPAFVTRLVLAATLSSNYGVYGPAYELLVDEAVSGKEEYLDSEKYEVKRWDWEKEGNLREFIARVNRIRRENPALQTTGNVTFFPVDSENLLFFGKFTEDLSNILLVVVNLDPFHKQSGSIRVPLAALGLEPGNSFMVYDLLSNDRFMWHGEDNYIELDPQVAPAYIFRVHRRLRKEQDFDYFL